MNFFVKEEWRNNQMIIIKAYDTRYQNKQNAEIYATFENDEREYSPCKYCGKLIKRGKVWNKDVFGNGYHHECYLKLQKYYSFLPQNDILGDD